MPSVGPILVLGEQPVIAALVGLLVELAGRQPVFAASDETPIDALERLRPVAAVLVDVRLDDVHSDLFFRQAARHRVGVAVFGSQHRAREVAEVASERSIPWFTIPTGTDELSVALNAAIGSSEQPRDRDRRQVPNAEETPDGTRILRDTNGRRWMVYDRRAARDRRRGETTDALDRVFVSEAGETRTYALGADEGEITAPELDRQLHLAN
jgi:hypothetical protein